MRTLKKALCLVLVLSMLAGFGVIGLRSARVEDVLHPRLDAVENGALLPWPVIHLVLISRVLSKAARLDGIGELRRIGLAHRVGTAHRRCGRRRLLGRNVNRALLILRTARVNETQVESLIFRFYDRRAILRAKNTTEDSVEYIYELNGKYLQNPPGDQSGRSITDAVYEIGGIEYFNIVMQNDEISG